MAVSVVQGLIQLLFGPTQDDPVDPLKQIKDVQEEISDRMKKISAYCGSEPVRIVLCGAVRVGKSSLVNNILSAFKGEIVQIVRCAEPDLRTPEDTGHITGKYVEYRIDMPRNDSKTHLLICDTRGIDKENPKERGEGITAALEGYYVSTEDMEGNQTADAKKREPTKRGQVAHVIIVVDATQVDVEDDRAPIIQSVLKKKELIPVSVVLTKCDRLDGDVARNIQKLYKSVKVKTAINQAHEQFKFVPKNRIFPVVNYTDQTKAEPQRRLVTLRALNIILSDIESCMGCVVRDA